MGEKIYTDGSGDGRMAWFNETTGESWSDRRENITSNEAEYLAVHSALQRAKSKDIEILSDSKLVVNQLNREWHIKDDRMRALFDKVQDIVKDRRLTVTFKWIRRSENPAGKYLG
jgi:ribonuclease HI